MERAVRSPQEMTEFCHGPGTSWLQGQGRNSTMLVVKDVLTRDITLKRNLTFTGVAEGTRCVCGLMGELSSHALCESYAFTGMRHGAGTSVLTNIREAEWFAAIVCQCRLSVSAPLLQAQKDNESRCRGF